MKLKFLLGLIAVGLIVGIYRVGTEALQEKLQTYLTHSFGQPVTIKAVHFIFPPAVYCVGLTVGTPSSGRDKPLLTIDQLSIQISFLKFLEGRWGMELELTNPKLFLIRDARGMLNDSFRSLLRNGTMTSQHAVFLNRVRVRNGQVTFVDWAISPETLWRAENLSLSFGLSPKVKGYRFDALAFLENSSQSAGTLEVGGEVDWNGAGEVTMSLVHCPLERLAPYLHQILGVAPAKGICTIKSSIAFQKILLTARTEVMAQNVLFPAKGQTIFELSGNQLVELLKDKENVVHLSFDVSGPLGGQINWPNLMHAAFRESVHEAMTSNIQKLLTDVEKRKPVEELIQTEGESLGR